MYGDLRGLFSARDASSLRWSGRNCWIASTKARKSPLPLREQIKGSVEVSKAGRGSQQRCGCLGLTDSPCNYLHVCSSAYGRLVFVPVCRSANSSTTGTTRRLSSRSRNSGPSLRWTWSSLWMDAAGSSEPRRCKTSRRASAKSVSTQDFFGGSVSNEVPFSALLSVLYVFVRLEPSPNEHASDLCIHLMSFLIKAVTYFRLKVCFQSLGINLRFF
jgi:hypothetical protein